MATAELQVLTAGLATVQDLGRPGLGHLGVAENGAADGWAARVANVLVGNAPGAPLVEVTGSELALRGDADLLVSVTGAASHVVVDGVRQPAWETLVVSAGRRLVVPAPEHGLRCYLAVNGRLDVAPVLGSVAPDRLLGVGRPLHGGDRIGLTSAFGGLQQPYLDLPVFRLGAVAPGSRQPLEIETTAGPDAHEFSQLTAAGLVDEYEVSVESDAIGLRLLGPTPRRSSSHEILSRGVPVGAVEVPPAGGLLLLLRGRLVTAGYPVVAIVTTDGVDRLGQARPGDRVRFTRVDVDRARASRRARLAELESLTARVRTALIANGLAAVLDLSRSPGPGRADRPPVPSSTANNPNEGETP